jgi:tRNA pseudouridine38-40 synthase
MVYIGEGRFNTDWAREVLEKRERPSDSLVFPAKGLTFTGVDYPADSELHARILKTMAIRAESSEEE